MRQCDNKGAVARRVNAKRAEATTAISQTASLSTTLTTLHESKLYLWEQFIQSRPCYVIKSVVYSSSVSSRKRRRASDPYVGSRWCKVKGVYITLLLIQIFLFAFWSMWSTVVDEYGVTKTISKSEAGDSTPKWSQQSNLHFVATLRLPEADVTVESGLMAQEVLSTISIPKQLTGRAQRRAMSRDFGGLAIKPLPRPDEKRRIKNEPRQMKTEFREATAARDDDVEYYIDADDDYSRIHYDDDEGDASHDAQADDDEEDEEEENGCRYVSDYHLNFQNCNIFHETPLLQSQLKFLGYVY
jgi:hypothetical protein